MFNPCNSCPTNYTPNVHNQPTCLPRETEVGIALSNQKYNYTFNGTRLDQGRVKIGKGVYTLRNIPKSHPMAILNRGLARKITYSGNNDSQVIGQVADSTANGKYNFYWGDITITVTGDFEMVSVYCNHHGSMGGEYALQYDKNC